MKIKFIDRAKVLMLKKLQFITKVKFFLLSASIGIGIVLIIEWNSTKLELILKDTSKVAILASTLGAVVGGLTTYFINSYAILKQNKMKNALLNKKTIYEPLLIEFKEIRKNLNSRNSIIKFSLSQTYSTISNQHFHVWGRIKIDTRIYRVPDYIKKYINNLENKIEQYEKYKSEVGKDIYHKVTDILKTYGYNIDQSNCGLSSSLNLKDIIYEKNVEKWRLMIIIRDSTIVGLGKISDEHFPFIAQDLNMFLNEKDYPKVFNNNIDSIIEALEECIVIIESIIINIIKQYERNNMF